MGIISLKLNLTFLSQMPLCLMFKITCFLANLDNEIKTLSIPKILGIIVVAPSFGKVSEVFVLFFFNLTIMRPRTNNMDF